MSDQPDRGTSEPQAPPELPRPSDDAEILGVIADIAREKLGRHGPLAIDAPLVEGLALDSIRQLTLMVELEDRLRVCLDETDEASIRTLGDLVALIRRKRGG